MEDCLKVVFFSPVSSVQAAWRFSFCRRGLRETYIFKTVCQVPYKSFLFTFTKLQSHGCEIFYALSLLQAVPHISC